MNVVAVKIPKSKITPYLETPSCNIKNLRPSTSYVNGFETDIDFSQLGISSIGYIALLAKKIGIVNTCPIPINRSRVFTIHATISEKVENKAEPIQINNTTPLTSTALNDTLIPNIKAKK